MVCVDCQLDLLLAQLYIVTRGVMLVFSTSLSLSLVSRFGGQVRHYRLYYDAEEKRHLVGRYN